MHPAGRTHGSSAGAAGSEELCYGRGGVRRQRATAGVKTGGSLPRGRAEHGWRTPAAAALAVALDYGVEPLGVLLAIRVASGAPPPGGCRTTCSRWA